MIRLVSGIPGTGCAMNVQFLVEVRMPLAYPEIGCAWLCRGGRPFLNAQAANAFAAGLRGSGAAHVRVRPVSL